VAKPKNKNTSDGGAAIEINLNRLPQLFNSLDPSPFHERDLDKDAEEYIIGSVEEILHHHHHPSALVIYLPMDQIPEAGAADLGEAIHNYFAYRETYESRRLRMLFRDGRIALAIGLGFLFSCVLSRELILSLGHSATRAYHRMGRHVCSFAAPKLY
jgi:hypothetical protein